MLLSTPLCPTTPLCVRGILTVDATQASPAEAQEPCHFARQGGRWAFSFEGSGLSLVCRQLCLGANVEWAAGSRPFHHEGQQPITGSVPGTASRVSLYHFSEPQSSPPQPRRSLGAHCPPQRSSLSPHPAQRFLTENQMGGVRKKDRPQIPRPHSLITRVGSLSWFWSGRGLPAPCSDACAEGRAEGVSGTHSRAPAAR